MTRSQDPPSGRSGVIKDLSSLSGSAPASSVRRARVRHLGAEALLSGTPEMVGRGGELTRLEESFNKTMYRRKASAVLIHGPSGVGKNRLTQALGARLIGGGARYRMLEARPMERDLGYIISLMRSRFKEEIESSVPAHALVTTLRMLVPTHEVVEVCFTVAALLGVELPTRHTSLESLGQLLDDTTRRKPFLVDILQRIFRREAERLPLFVVLRHPERADEESQAILSEVIPSWEALPIFVVSLQNDANFRGPKKKKKAKFIPSYTGPGTATITDFDITRLGKDEVTRIADLDVGSTTKRLKKAPKSAPRPESVDPEATAWDMSASVAEDIDALDVLANSDGDATLVLDNSAKQLYQAPHIFGLECELMALRPLPDMQMESLVRRILEPVSLLPDALVGMLLTRLEGIPGRLRQHITALVTHGVLERAEDGAWGVVLERLRGDSMPSDLDSLSRARIEKLPEKHRIILKLAGVVGPLFRVRDVLTLMRLEGDEGEAPFFEKRTESRLRRVLLDLQGQEFIIYEPRLGPQGDEAFRFRFERERDLLLQSVDEDRARLMHRVLAQVLETRGADPEEVARHWQEGGATRRASLALLRGGEAYGRAFKAQKAVEALERALKELGLDEGEATLKGMTALAQSYMVLGEFARVETLCKAQAQGAYALGMPLYGARAFLLRAGAARHIGDLDRAAEQLEMALELAERLEGSEALALKAEILDELSLNRWQHGAHFSEALELADQALNIREQLGDVANTARTLLNIGQIQYARQRLDDAQSCLERAARLAESEDLRQVLARAKNGLGILAMTRGDHLAAQRLWAEVLDISQSLGDRALRAAVLSNLGELAWMSSNPRLANDLLRRSVDLARSIGEYRVSSESLRLLSRIAISEVQLPTAVDLAKQALSEARRSGNQIRISLALRNLAEVWSHTLFQDSFKDSEDIRTQVVASPFSALDREKEAQGCFEEAISMLEAMGNRIDLRDTLASYRMFLIERGRAAESEAIARRLEAIDS